MLGFYFCLCLVYFCAIFDQDWMMRDRDRKVFGGVLLEIENTEKMVCDVFEEIHNYNFFEVVNCLEAF